MKAFASEGRILVFMIVERYTGFGPEPVSSYGTTKIKRYYLIKNNHEFRKGRACIKQPLHSKRNVRNPLHYALQNRKKRAYDRNAYIHIL